MSTVAIIQARMGSERLPGKVLVDIVGEPMLAHVVTRTDRARMVDRVVVATTDASADDPVEVLCRRRGWACFRGSEGDVLDRYYQAAVEHAAATVVRITGDCPLIDPGEIDRVVREYRSGGPFDYTSNWLPPRTFPRGLDTEAFRFDALGRAWREDDNPAWREHVTQYIRRHPERFRLRAVVDDMDRSAIRWTVDTAEDLELVQTMFEHFGHDRFSWRDALAAYEAHPAWARLNRDVAQKEVG
jgi:spore coat polysaccharide biosynthesis protein SpsF